MIYPLNKLIIKLKYNDFFSKINSIRSDLTREEKITLYLLSHQKRGSIFVEIGSYLGVSSIIIAMGIIHTHKNSKLFCIDTWQNDAMSEGKKNTFEEFLINTHDYHTIITPIRGWSHEIAENFIQKIDFLFIDGGHSYDDVKKDVDLWMPKLNTGALLVMHDSGWAEGVQRVIREDVSPRAKREGRLPNMYWAWL